MIDLSAIQLNGTGQEGRGVVVKENRNINVSHAGLQVDDCIVETHRFVVDVLPIDDRTQLKGVLGIVCRLGHIFGDTA